MAVGEDEFRAAMRRWPTGVSVLTARSERGHHGMTANSFTAVSLDPVLILVCVEKAARFHAAVEATGAFGISVLADDQEDIARWFALRGRPYEAAEFADFGNHEAPSGVLLLDNSLATLECRTTAVHDGGDHSILVAQVVTAEVLRPDAGPLLYFDGDYGTLVRG
ncbi:MAG: flavin reductase family protein [Frankia sp.]|nr:flavin reductase family protein [Frankia sp.]